MQSHISEGDWVETWRLRYYPGRGDNYTTGVKRERLNSKRRQNPEGNTYILELQRKASTNSSCL
jgi:hypothetical protein